MFPRLMEVFTKLIKDEFPGMHASLDIFTEFTQKNDQAVQLYRQGKYEAAIDVFESAIKISEKANSVSDAFAITHFFLGVCFIHMDKPDLADEQFSIAIETAPPEKLKQIMATAGITKLDGRKAQTIWNLWVPKCAHHISIESYERALRYCHAIIAFKHTQFPDKSYAAVYRGMSVTYFHLNSLEAAKNALNIAIKLDPTIPKDQLEHLEADKIKEIRELVAKYNPGINSEDLSAVTQAIRQAILFAEKDPDETLQRLHTIQKKITLDRVTASFMIKLLFGKKSDEAAGIAYCSEAIAAEEKIAVHPERAGFLGFYHHIRGFAYYRQFQFERARIDFNAYIRYTLEKGVFGQTKHEYLMLSHSLAECEANLSAKDPKFEQDTYMVEAYTHLKKNTQEGSAAAIVFFNALVRHSPNTSKYYIDRAVCYLHLAALCQPSSPSKEKKELESKALDDINRALWLHYTEIDSGNFDTHLEYIKRKVLTLTQIADPHWEQAVYQTYVVARSHISKDDQRNIMADHIYEQFTLLHLQFMESNPTYAASCLDVCEKIKPDVNKAKLPDFIDYTLDAMQLEGKVVRIRERLHKCNPDKDENLLQDAARNIAAAVIETNKSNFDRKKILDYLAQAEQVCRLDYLGFILKANVLNLEEDKEEKTQKTNRGKALVTLNAAIEAEHKVLPPHPHVLPYLYFMQAVALFDVAPINARKSVLRGFECDPYGQYPASFCEAIVTLLHRCDSAIVTQNTSPSSHKKTKTSFQIPADEAEEDRKRAYELYNRKKYAEAWRHFNMLILVSPATSNLYADRADCIFSLKGAQAIDEAIGDLNTALWLIQTNSYQTSPANVHLFYNRKKNFLLQAERYEEAYKCHQVELSHCKSEDMRQQFNLEFYAHCVFLAESSKVEERITAYYGLAIKTMPDHPGNKFLIAKAATQKKAKTAQQAAPEQKKEEQTAVADEKIQNSDEVIQKLTKEIKEHEGLPEEKQVRATLARLYFERGNAYFVKKEWTRANNDFIYGMLLDQTGEAYKKDIDKLHAIFNKLIQCEQHLLHLNLPTDDDQRAKLRETLSSKVAPYKNNMVKHDKTSLLYIHQLINLTSPSSYYWAERAHNHFAVNKKNVQEAFDDVGVAIWLCLTGIDQVYQGSLYSHYSLRRDINLARANIEESKKDHQRALNLCTDAAKKVILKHQFSSNLRSLAGTAKLEQAIEYYELAHQVLDDSSKKEKAQVKNKLKQLRNDLKKQQAESAEKQQEEQERVRAENKSREDAIAAAKKTREDKLAAETAAKELKDLNDKKAAARAEKKREEAKQKKADKNAAAKKRKAERALTQPPTSSPEPAPAVTTTPTDAVATKTSTPDEKTEEKKTETPTISLEQYIENIGEPELPKEADYVLSKLKRAFLVGSGVLNAIERTPQHNEDLDIVCAETVEEMMAAFPEGEIVPDFYNKNLAHYYGGDVPVDIYHSPHLANQNLTLEEQLAADANDRDLTSSSLYLPKKEPGIKNKVLDPTKRGLRHFKDGIIATNKIPSVSLKEDTDRQPRAIDAKNKNTQRYSRRFRFASALETQLRKNASLLKTDHTLDGKVIARLLKMCGRACDKENIADLLNIGELGNLLPALDKGLVEKDPNFSVINHLAKIKRGKVNTWIFKLLSNSLRLRVTPTEAKRYFSLLKETPAEGLYFHLLALLLQKRGQDCFEQLAETGVRAELFTYLKLDGANTIAEVVEMISVKAPHTVRTCLLNLLDSIEGEKNLALLIQQGVIQKLFPGLSATLNTQTPEQNLIAIMTIFNRDKPRALVNWVTNLIERKMRRPESRLSADIHCLLEDHHLTRSLNAWLLTLFLDKDAKQHIEQLTRLNVIADIYPRLAEVLTNTTEPPVELACKHLLPLSDRESIQIWLNKVLAQPDAATQIARLIDLNVLQQLLPEVGAQFTTHKEKVLLFIQSARTPLQIQDVLKQVKQITKQPAKTEEKHASAPPGKTAPAPLHPPQPATANISKNQHRLIKGIKIAPCSPKTVPEQPQTDIPVRIGAAHLYEPRLLRRPNSGINRDLPLKTGKANTIGERSHVENVSGNRKKAASGT